MGYLKQISVLLLFVVMGLQVVAQDEVVLPEASKFKEPKTKMWFNSYGKIRISKRLFWDAQTHLRLEETKETPFFGQVAQMYNRHAIGYIYNKKINFSLGGVLRLNFNTNEDSEDQNMVPEFRIWHQYQFAQELYSAMIYHRIRIEHRWSKGFPEDAEYIFRNRWRYMFRAKIPLNSHKLEPKTIYVSPESELIMQSGKEVVGSVMEDLRLTTTLGYIVNPRLTFAAGAMYSHGQTLQNPGEFSQNWTVRLHCYFSPDIRKVKNKLPAIHLDD